MGVVVSGMHVTLSQRIAIKFLRVWTPDGVTRFEREARACAKISNEHIVRVLDVDALPNGMPFMVMEYLEGKDLSAVLKARGRLKIEEAVDYVLQACEALAEAHRNGIIHRDLKPANLFLTQRSDGSPLVKVLDFGVSKIRTSDASPAEELTTTNALIGSPSYMSPEQLRAARDVDARSDIWALGAVLHKLIAGRTPFIAPSTPDLCIQILTEDVSADPRSRPARRFLRSAAAVPREGSRKALLRRRRARARASSVVVANRRRTRGAYARPGENTACFDHGERAEHQHRRAGANDDRSVRVGRLATEKKSVARAGGDAARRRRGERGLVG